MSAASGGRPSAGWPLLAMFTGLQALAFGDRFVLSVLSTPVSLALHIDDVRMGWLQGTAFIVPFVLFTPLFGVLVDRVPRGWPVLAGLGVSTLAMVWSATADGFKALLCARVLLGVGEAAVAPAALVQVARAAAAGRAGLGTALFAAGGPIGKGLALTAGGAVLGALTHVAGPAAPWREVLGATAAMNLLAMAAAACALLPAKAAEAAQERIAAARPAPDTFKLAAAAAAGVAAVLASQTAAAWAPTLFVRRFGMAPAQAGLAAGTPLLLLSPACGFALGWLLDRTARRGPETTPVLPWLAACLTTSGGLSLALSAARDATSAQLVFAALAAALGAGAVVGLRAVQVYARDGWRGRLTAGYIAAANLIGFGVGPPLVGWLATASSQPSGLQAALTTVLAGASAAGVAAVLAAGVGSARLRPSGRSVRLPRRLG